MTREEQIKQACINHTEATRPIGAGSSKITDVQLASAYPNIYELNVYDIPKGFSVREILEMLTGWEGRVVLVEKKSPWISVEDRLPEEGEIVTKAYLWSQDEVLYTTGMFCVDEDLGGDCGMIAWMPIPELPKKGEEL